MGEFNQKRFRELLKKGIGLRTQKEFAAQVGMAAATINRMLNDEQVSCPKMRTLETFAANMRTVTLPELMTACGYEAPDIKEVVNSFESDISDFFAFEPVEGFKMFESMDEALRTMDEFLKMKRDVSNITADEDTDEEIPGYTLKKGAESSKNIQIQWTYGRYACTTDFRIYYTETAKGRIILVGSDIDLKNSENGHAGHTVIKNKTHAAMEEKLLNAIFGEPSDWLPDITAGYGFEFNEIPEGFGDFLNAHADTFCDSEENIRLYNRFVAGEKPEDVFEDFCVNGWSCGPGAVVADIMSKETGREYQYFEPDKNVSEENRNACVMERAKENFVLRIEEQTLLYLFKCAKELKIPEFGAVYHYGTCTKAVNQIYQTDKFWLE